MIIDPVCSKIGRQLGCLHAHLQSLWQADFHIAMSSLTLNGHSILR